MNNDSNRVIEWLVCCCCVIPNFPLYCCHTELVSLFMRYNNNTFIFCANIGVYKFKIKSGFDDHILFTTVVKKINQLVPEMYNNIKKSQMNSCTILF